MEEVHNNHVLGELQSQQPLLQLRACWMYGQFCNYNFKDTEKVQKAADGIYQLFSNSKHLPVKLEAGIALSKFLKNPIVEEFLRNGLSSVMESFLSLMQEVDSEDLVTAFETFMEVFCDEMPPHAVKIVKHLVTQYERLIKVDVEDDDGEALLAATGCVSAARRLIDGCAKQKDLILQLQVIMYPVLQQGLSLNGLEIIEEVIDMVNQFTFFGVSDGEQIPIEMWRLYSSLLFVLVGKDGDMDGGYGLEFIDRAMITLMSYICKDPQSFQKQTDQQDVYLPQGMTYIQSTFKMLDKVLIMNQNDHHKIQGQCCMKIITVMLENFECQNYLPQNDFNIVGRLLKELNQTDKNTPKDFKSSIFQAFSMAFFNNALVTIQLIEQQNQIQQVFGEWFAFMAQFKQETELRRIIFGLVSIVKNIQPSQMPEVIQQQISIIGLEVVNLVIRVNDCRIKSAISNEKYIARGGVEDDQESEGEANVHDMEAEDNFEDVDGEEGMEDDDFGSMDDSYDEEEDLEGCGLFSSATDKIDELFFVRDAMAELQQSQPDLLNALFGKVEQKKMDKMQKAVNEAQQMKDREQKNKKTIEELEAKNKNKMSREAVQQMNYATSNLH